MVDFKTSLPAVAIVVVIAIALGGGGVRYGMANLVVQLAALTVAWLYRDSFFAFWNRAPWSVRILTAASIALPALHAIPLPEALWTALPGRELAADARAAVGALGWAPLSVDSSRSLVALSGLIVPLIILACGWRIPRERLVWLGWLIVALGLANALIGIPQAFSGSPTASFYPETPMPGVLFGTFANRNSTGLFLVCGLILVALLPSTRAHRAMLIARVAIALLLLAAIVLTQSRTALALAALPLVLALVKLGSNAIAPNGPQGVHSKPLLAVAGLGIAVLVAVTSIGLAAPGRLGDTLERFEGEQLGPRNYIWEDALYASDRYWPVGAGMGTFDEVFQIDESLENMTLRRAGRAHNDYIEVAIEAGAPGLLLIAGWLILLVVVAIRARGSPHRWTAWSGAAILLAIALQSITDYPLRNQAMLATASLALLCLVRCGIPATKRSTAPRQQEDGA